ncbi:MAG: hypothetical protein COB41_00165 [Proteobacteria bacterium]|nr:MAG: hypothetical protein COB41_00165 [Pseudomonadota bacterium]
MLWDKIRDKQIKVSTEIEALKVYDILISKGMRCSLSRQNMINTFNMFNILHIRIRRYTSSFGYNTRPNKLSKFFTMKDLGENTTSVYDRLKGMSISYSNDKELLHIESFLKNNGILLNNLSYETGTNVTISVHYKAYNLSIIPSSKNLTFNGFKEFFSPDSTLTIKSSGPECQHSWSTYEGFTEIFDYCSICDVRKGLNV